MALCIQYRTNEWQSHTITHVQKDRQMNRQTEIQRDTRPDGHVAN
jgi:hypothetical protein